MADTNKTYAQFNAITVTGRIFHAEIPKGRDFLAVTVISTLENDGQSINFTFNNSNGLKALFEKGFLAVGRTVTITGHVNRVAETYEKDGKLLMKARPEIHLKGVQILDGGLGPMPKAAEVNTTGVEVTMEPKAPVAAAALDPAQM